MASTNHIFISYHPADSSFVRRLADDLEKVGAIVWTSHSGVSKLNESALLLLVMSPHAMDDSRVESEWASFLEHGRPLVPLYWRECEPHYRLARLQYVDFRGHQMSYGGAFNSLLYELGQDHYLDIWLAPPRPTAGTVPQHYVREIIRQQSKRHPPITWRMIYTLLSAVLLVAIGVGMLVYIALQANQAPPPGVGVPASPTPSAPDILLQYDKNVFLLINQNTAPLDVSRLVFENTEGRFMANRWAGLSAYRGKDALQALPSGRCFQIVMAASQIVASGVCRQPMGWVVAGRDEKFWQASEFTVFDEGRLLSKCPPSPASCPLTLIERNR